MIRKKVIAFMITALLITALAGCQSGLRPTPEPTLDSSSDITAEPSSGMPSTPLPSNSQEPPTEQPPTPGTTESPAAQTMDIAVYYLKSGERDFYLIREVHTLPKSEGVARAALNELISGTPVTEGAYRVLPAGTQILGIKIEDGLATVDFSKEVLYANVGASGEGLGIDSVVNTLTEFPTIRQVAFTVEGSAQNGMDWWGHVGLYEQPFARRLGMVREPAIWVTAPAGGKKVVSPIKLQGSAQVFEATVCYRLTDTDGNILAEGFTTAVNDDSFRGNFDVSIPFNPTAARQGQLEVFAESAENGNEIHKVIIPVTW